MEVAAKVQGQVAGGPLPNGEQFSAGGIGTVRGYLESAALGDNALLGSLELRGPLLVGKRGEKGNEWLFYVFCEGGFLTVRDVLPEQTSRFELASIGAGTRIGFREHFHGSLDAGLPLIGQGRTGVHDLLVTFRLWADF
jgi:hemolysin activation/secretion protein